MLTERDIPILVWLSRCFLLRRKQVQRLCFPNDREGRSTRRRLNALVQDGLIKRRNLHVVNPRDGSSAPVYNLTANGRAVLAGHLDDPAIMLLPVEPKQPQYLFHYLSVAETAILFHQAAENESDLEMPRFLLEDHVVNVHEPGRTNHFALELISQTPQRKIVCDPDAAFELCFGDSRAVFYVEVDRDREWQGKVASKKNPGYQYLHEQQLHRRHFPDTTLPYFFVLFIAPTPKRRDQLREAFSYQNKDNEHGKLFRFAAFPELQQAVESGGNLFFDPLFYRADSDEAVPLVKR